MTFIASTIYDNQILLKTNPSYLANLKALPLVERRASFARQLENQTRCRDSTSRECSYAVFSTNSPIRCCFVGRERGDARMPPPRTRAANPAYTAGVLMGKRRDGTYVVADVVNVRMGGQRCYASSSNLPQKKDRAMFGSVHIRLPQGPRTGWQGPSKELCQVHCPASLLRQSRRPALKRPEQNPLPHNGRRVTSTWYTALWNEVYLDQL